MTLPPEIESADRSRLQRVQRSRRSTFDERSSRGRVPNRLPTAASSPAKTPDVPELFELFPYGLVLADRQGRILTLNRRARQLLIPTSSEVRLGRACCELICNRTEESVGVGCLAERALSGAQLDEVPIGIGEQEHEAAWVTVSVLNSIPLRVLFHLRPSGADDPGSQVWSPPRPAEDHRLSISTLGRFRVEGESGPITGKWLDQRPGQLLKYLVCERRRMVSSDQISEAIWNEIGLDKARNRIRYQVHALRQKLEPDRPFRSPAGFVVARGDGYALDTSLIWIDADEFEHAATAGLSAFEQGHSDPAASQLSRALDLYRDDFLCEEPYLECALEERDRIRELVGRALRAKVKIELDLGRLDTAADDARRLSDLEPLDSDVQRLFIAICLERGRRSEATRRYSLLRQRMLSAFGQEPDFELQELGPESQPVRPSVSS